MTIPTYRHRPGGPHLDGITPLPPDGTPFTFTLLAHYLLAHNIGGHFGPPEAQWRRTLYYRISAAGHKQRWRTIVTDPLHEFR